MNVTEYKLIQPFIDIDSIIITENMNTDNTVEKFLSNSRKYKRTFLNIYKLTMLFSR